MKPNGGCKAHAAVNNISRNEHHPTVESKDPTRGSRRVEDGTLTFPSEPPYAYLFSPDPPLMTRLKASRSPS
ncbi:hypothetical protein GQ457_04G039060 [Hibiscus cannabinus]